MADIKNIIGLVKQKSGKQNNFSQADVTNTINKIKEEISSGNFSNASMLQILGELNKDATFNAADTNKDGFYQETELINLAKFSLNDSKTQLTEADIKKAKGNSFVPGAPTTSGTPSSTSTPSTLRGIPTTPAPLSSGDSVEAFAVEKNTPAKINEYIKKSCERKFAQNLYDGNISEVCVLDTFNFGNGKSCKPFFNPSTNKLHLVVFENNGSNAPASEITVDISDGYLGGNVYLGTSQDAISNESYLRAPGGSKVILATKGINKKNREALTKQIFEKFLKGKSFDDVSNGRIDSSAEVRKTRNIDGLFNSGKMSAPTESGELKPQSIPATHELKRIDEELIGKIDDKSNSTVTDQTSWFIDEKGINPINEVSAKSKLIKMEHSSGGVFYILVRLVERKDGQKVIEQFRLREITLKRHNLASKSSTVIDVMNNIHDHLKFPTSLMEAYQNKLNGELSISEIRGSYTVTTGKDLDILIETALKRNTTQVVGRGYATEAERDAALKNFKATQGESLFQFEKIEYKAGEDLSEYGVTKTKKYGVKRTGINVSWFEMNGTEVRKYYPSGESLDDPKTVSNNGTNGMGIRDFYTELKGVYDAEPAGNNRPKLITTIKSQLPKLGPNGNKQYEERQIILEGNKVYVVCARKSSLGDSKRIYAFNLNSDVGTRLEEAIGLERHESLEDILLNLDDFEKNDEKRFKSLLSFFGHNYEFLLNGHDDLEYYNFSEKVSALNQLKKKLLK